MRMHTKLVLSTETLLPHVVFTAGVAISFEAVILWMDLLYPVIPLNYFSGIKGACLQKSTFAGRPGV